jgi:hypothetical protein
MSLAEFQRAFADLIASPEDCLRARGADHFRDPGYDLTERERRRLAAMARDEAMSANCTLYRVNRLTPVYSVLPLTCRLLADDLAPELEGFWRASRDATLQYGWESWRFGLWLQQRIEAGAIAGGPLADAIAFELAAYEVRTAPRSPGAAGADPARRRWLQVRHDPDALLDPGARIADIRALPAPCWLLLDASGDELEVRRVSDVGAVPTG